MGVDEDDLGSRSEVQPWTLRHKFLAELASFRSGVARKLFSEKAPTAISELLGHPEAHGANFVAL